MGFIENGINFFIRIYCTNSYSVFCCAIMTCNFLFQVKFAMDSPKPPFVKSYSLPSHVERSISKSSTRQRRAKSPGRCLTSSVTRSANAISCDTSMERYLQMNGGMPLIASSHEEIKRGPDSQQSCNEVEAEDSRPSKRRKLHTASSPNKEKPSVIVRIIMSILRFLKLFLSLVMAFTCLVITLVFIIEWMKERCQILHSAKFNTTAIRSSLSSRIFGQEIGMEVILSELTKYEASGGTNQSSILWCVGWSGSGKSKTMDIIKEHLTSDASVHYILPSFMPEGEDAIRVFAQNIYSELNPCRKDIVIVDGWDDKQDGVPKLVSALLFLVNKSPEQILLVVSGSKGSKHINQVYLANRLEGIARENISKTAFLDSLIKTPEYDELNSLGPVAIAPYLPLERHHVNKCLQQEFARVKMMQEKGYLDLKNGAVLGEMGEDIVKSVFSSLSFVPKEFPILCSSGCKRIFPLLKLHLGDVDSRELWSVLYYSMSLYGWENWKKKNENLKRFFPLLKLHLGDVDSRELWSVLYYSMSLYGWEN